MDSNQGDTQGKSITSKLKAKVKGVKGKVHLPGHKKRHGDDNQANESDSSGYSSDDSLKKPGPETGYNVGASTPFTTVKTTPLSPAREKTTSYDSHNRDYDSHTRDYDSRPSHTTSGYDSQPSYTTSGYDALNPSSAPPTRPAPMVTNSPSSMAPTLDEKFQYRDVDTTSTTEGYTPKIDYAGESLASPANPTKPREGVLGNIKDTVGGAAAAVGSKMGYYTEVDQTPVVPTPRDPYAPSVIDKAKHTLGMDKPKDPFAPTMMEKTKATLGLDKPSDPYAPTMMEKTKATLGLDKPSDPYAPTMMEKTKATLGMDKPSDPYAPTMMEKTKATLGLAPSSPTSVTSPAAGTPSGTQPGVIDRVTGAMSSLFTGAPKAHTGEAVQDTFPAQTDYVPPAATVPHQSYTVRSGDDMTRSTVPGEYNSTMNRY